MPFTIRAAGLTACIFASSALSQPTTLQRHVHHRRREAIKPAIPNIAVVEPSAAITLPTVAPRNDLTYDLDGNGALDICKQTSDTLVECKLFNGDWVNVPINPHPMSTTADAVVVAAAATPTPTTTSKLPKGTLPSAAQFLADNGTKWSVTPRGQLGYSGYLGTQNLQGDKARTGSLGGQVIWNFGDMECDGNPLTCGFDMGPAMYGYLDNPLLVNTQNISNIHDASFIKPHTSNNFFTNEVLGNGCTAWGMDNSNVAALNDTHGIVYSWEIWRGCPTADGKNDAYIDRGLTASVITLGAQFPKAERVSGILAGADNVATGLDGILNSGGYIYSYTVEVTNTTSGGTQNNVLVGRARVDDPDIYSQASSYEFFSPSNNSWVRGIPYKSDAAAYNMATAQPGGWTCAVYGSVMYSNYLDKYMLFCDAWESEFLFYTADNPQGPWSEMYSLLTGFPGYYGAMVHPVFTESHKSLVISFGPNSVFDEWIWELDYDV